MAISEDGAISFGVKTFDLIGVPETSIFHFLYFRGALKAKICLEYLSKITTLLNTYTKINVIIKKFMEDTNSFMRQGSKLKFVLHIGYG